MRALLVVLAALATTAWGCAAGVGASNGADAAPAVPDRGGDDADQPTVADAGKSALSIDSGQNTDGAGDPWPETPEAAAPPAPSPTPGLVCGAGQVQPTVVDFNCLYVPSPMCGSPTCPGTVGLTCYKGGLPQFSAGFITAYSVTGLTVLACVGGDVYTAPCLPAYEYSSLCPITANDKAEGITINAITCLTNPYPGGSYTPLQGVPDVYCTAGTY